MKATFKSMMVIGMMILGTATAFGKSNFNVDKYNATKAPYTMIVHKDCKIRHKHDKYCGNSFVVRMDRRWRNTSLTVNTSSTNVECARNAVSLSTRFVQLSAK